MQTTELRRNAKPRNVTAATIAVGVMVDVHVLLSSRPCNAVQNINEQQNELHIHNTYIHTHKHAFPKSSNFVT